MLEDPSVNDVPPGQNSRRGSGLGPRQSSRSRRAVEVGDSTLEPFDADPLGRLREDVTDRADPGIGRGAEEQGGRHAAILGLGDRALGVLEDRLGGRLSAVGVGNGAASYSRSSPAGAWPRWAINASRISADTEVRSSAARALSCTASSTGTQL